MTEENLQNPASEQLASVQARFGAALLDAALLVVTLVIGCDLELVYLADRTEPCKADLEASSC